ncbi:helix-hairpin-helix domain-containing protein [bacterium]|nr:helix-hairpin-helix domain-containing protein [bacterium]
MKNLLLRMRYVLLSVVFSFCLVSAAQADVSKININTATEQELCMLKRVGSSYAAKIIAYREQNGLFQVPEDIMKVKGIGLKTFEANREIIIVKEEELAKKTTQ